MLDTDYNVNKRSRWCSHEDAGDKNPTKSNHYLYSAIGLVILSLIGIVGCVKQGAESTVANSNKELPFNGFRALDWNSWILNIHPEQKFYDSISLEDIYPANPYKDQPVIWLKVAGDSHIAKDSQFIWVKEANARFAPFLAENLWEFWQTGSSLNPGTNSKISLDEIIILSRGSKRGFPISFSKFTIGKKSLPKEFWQRKDFRKANLEDVQCLQCELSNKDFQGANLKDSIFEFATFNYANLSNAFLTKVSLSNAKAYSAQFDNSDLSEANLNFADFTGSRFRNKTILSKAYGTKTYFSWAKLAKADLTEARLINADFEGADLSGAILIKADLKGAIFKNATLDKADFNDAILEGADLSDTNLKNAINLHLANTRGVKTNKKTVFPKGFCISK